jgi:VWFA-related protein
MNLVRPALVSALAGACLLGSGLSASSERTRSIYVTAVDKAGAPVLDLLSTDFEVKENGKVREVRSLDPATRRMQIALIVDDNGTGLFRSTVAQFVQRLRSEAEFSITVVVGQALKLVDFTTDFSKLVEAVGFLGAKPATPDGGQLLGTIYEVARDLKNRESLRPVMVVMTVGGEEHNPMSAHQVLEQIRDSRATLNVLEMTSSMLRPTQAIDRASKLLEESLNINEVIGDGSKQSGGRRDEVVAVTGMAKDIQMLANELSHQYELTYVLPDGVVPAEKLTVAVKRGGVTLRAPTRMPLR